MLRPLSEGRRQHHVYRSLGQYPSCLFGAFGGQTKIPVTEAGGQEPAYRFLIVYNQYRDLFFNGCQICLSLTTPRIGATRAVFTGHHYYLYVTSVSLK